MSFAKKTSVVAGICLTLVFSASVAEADNEDYFDRVRDHVDNQVDTLAWISILGIVASVKQTPGERLRQDSLSWLVGVNPPGPETLFRDAQSLRKQFHEYWDDVELMRDRFRVDGAHSSTNSFPPMVLGDGPIFLPGQNGQPRQVSKEVYLEYLYGK